MRRQGKGRYVGINGEKIFTYLRFPEFKRKALTLSYDIEWFCDYMGKKEDIWYATNGEIYDYVTAYNRSEWSVNGKTVYNPTTTDVYVCICGAKYVIKSGETVTLK